jgi:hypothetical protein
MPRRHTYLAIALLGFAASPLAQEPFDPNKRYAIGEAVSTSQPTTAAGTPAANPAETTNQPAAPLNNPLAAAATNLFDNDSPRRFTPGSQPISEAEIQALRRQQDFLRKMSTGVDSRLLFPVEENRIIGGVLERYNNLSTETKRLNEADIRDQIRSLCILYPKNGLLRQIAGQFEMEMGNKAAGVTYLRSAVKLAPYSPNIVGSYLALAGIQHGRSKQTIITERQTTDLDAIAAREETIYLLRMAIMLNRADTTRFIQENMPELFDEVDIAARIAPSLPGQTREPYPIQYYDAKNQPTRRSIQAPADLDLP